MKIKIVIRDSGKVKYIYADEELKDFRIDDIEIYKGVSTFVHTAINIVKNWPEQLGTPESSKIDFRYTIGYDDGNNSKTLQSYGEFPEDFYKLSNLIFSYEDSVSYNTQLNNIMDREEL